MFQRVKVVSAAVVLGLTLAVGALAQAPNSKPGLTTHLRNKLTVPFGHHKMGMSGAPGATSGSMTAHQGWWIGNVKTKVVHAPNSAGLPDPHNRVYFKTLADAVHKGYHLAKNEGMHPKGGPMGHSHRMAMPHHPVPH